MMTPIVYFSNVSENTHRFMQRLQRHRQTPGTLTSYRIPLQRTDIPFTMAESYILITPSYGTERTSHVPPQVKNFLKDETTRNHCVGVVGAGNINFGDEYAAAADAISRKLQIPILHKFELSGFDKDIAALQQITQLTKQDIMQRTSQLVAA